MSPVDKTVLEGISKGIQAELAAYVFYKKCIGITKDNNLRETLEKLAGEEKDHFRILEGQYDNLVRSEMWNTIADVLRQQGLPDIDENIEDVHEDFIEEVTPSTTPMRMLEIALKLEERARDLYNGFAQKVSDPKGKETYEYLAKFENGHALRIKKMIESYK